jgi:hypothetical protein
MFAEKDSPIRECEAGHRQPSATNPGRERTEADYRRSRIVQAKFPVGYCSSVAVDKRRWKFLTMGRYIFAVPLPSRLISAFFPK